MTYHQMVRPEYCEGDCHLVEIAVTAYAVNPFMANLHRAQPCFAGVTQVWRRIMKVLMTVVALAALMGSPVLAQTPAEDPLLFSVGPSETPSETVIVEGEAKSPIENPNVGLRPNLAVE
jgi:anti-sigma-K factor RskA